MGKRDKFKKAVSKVQEQVNSYRESRNQKLSDYATYFELDGLEQFNWKATKEGNRYVLDIIPFEVIENLPWKAKGNPPDIGDWWFNVDIHTHNSIGPNNEKVICPKHSFKNGVAKGDRAGCPICEDLAVRQEELRDDPDRRKEIWKELKPTRRNLYNVIVRDGGEEEEKGIQVFDVAYFYFQQNIEEAIDEDDDSGVTTYWDIDEGKQIQFKVFDQGKDQAPKFGAFKLKNRIDPVTKKPYVISDEELDASVSPQKWIKLYSYDELFEMYHQKPKAVTRAEDDDDEEEDARKPKPKKQVEDIEDLPSKPELAEDECPHGHRFGLDFNHPDHAADDCDNCDPDRYEACMKKGAELRRKKKNK